MGSQKFKFSLDKLLEIREQQEEESKRIFTESKRLKMKVESELNKMVEDYDNYKGIKPNEDVVYQKIKRRYLFALENGIKEKKKELKRRERDLEKKREDLKKKQVDRKTVSKLKEKQYLSFVKEQNRIEQLNNDEFALYAHMRNVKGGENE